MGFDMNKSHFLLSTFLGFAAACGFAEEQPAARVAQSASSLDALKKEFQGARQQRFKEWIAAETEAKKSGKEKDFTFDKPTAEAIYSPRFLAIAEHNPEGAEAIDALKMTLQTSFDRNRRRVLETRAKGVKMLRNHYVLRPEIKKVVGLVTAYDDPSAKALVADVLARNPDRTVQAAAYKGKIAYLEKVIGAARACSSLGR
jgi:hypothetical protein